VRGIGHPNSELRTPNSHSGVALIITLILLGVVTFMAIAFLALSRRERGAVTTVTDTASARLAADSALANAEGQIMANVLSTTNPYNFSLIVSTNYINGYGYNPTAGANPTNVNYDYRSDSQPFTLSDRLQNLANLYYSPRPPVFIPNPTNSTLPPDFRYYLDLNRNGRYDTNGWVTNLDNNLNGLLTAGIQVGDPEWIGVLQRPDQPYGPNNPFVARYAFIAIPVGNALDLNAIYNYAKRLNANMLPLNDSFYRNEGVGSWEINLAAFLADLNTNEWFYTYPTDISGLPVLGVANSGTAFDDALSLLRYRYGGNFNNLASVDNLFGPFGTPGDTAFRNDNIDGYSDGPLQTGFQLPGDVLVPSPNDNPLLPWAGADNTNHFFSHQELFDPTKAFSFSINLLNVGMTNWGGTTVSTYDRYTFYRLLSQLGTDSTPESGKMNLNYDNLDLGSNGVLTLNGTASATNFVGWQPLAFFTNAADRLLRAYTTQWRNGNPTNFATTFYTVTDFTFTNYPDNWTNYPAFGIGNIPVLVSKQFVYSSAVNRLLQLAANLYDATTNNAFALGKNYPSVFRPTFWVTNEYGYTNVYINGYQQVVSVVGTNDYQLNLPLEVTGLPLGASTNNFPLTGVNVYGVPWIIGAKKGFPNFNEFVMENVVGVTRRLQLTRNTNTSPPTMTGTNQMYLMSFNSSLGVDFWNSYAAQYNGTVSGLVRETLTLALTNDDAEFNAHPGIQQPMIFSTTSPIFENPWPGAGAMPWYGNNPNSASFVVPLGGTFPMLTNSVYRSPNASATAGTVPPNFTAPCLIPTNYFSIVNMTVLFETNPPPSNSPLFPLPHWGLLTTNQLQVFVLDQSANGIYHVIDYAHFEQINRRDLSAEIFNDDLNGNNIGVWNTNINPNTGVPFGIENQINISRGTLVPPGPPPAEDGAWKPDPQASTLGGTVTAQQASFQAFFQPLGSIASVGNWNNYGPGSASNYLTSVEAPYAPTRFGVGYTVMEANDPLVHYLASDMTPSVALSAGLTNHFNYDQPVPSLASLDLGKLNENYQPWGGNPKSGLSTWTTLTAYNLALKDPLVRVSDNWDFPGNKFPTVGWLGRVHRGTPWQTVYLKASSVLKESNGTNTWAQWTGNTQLTYGQYFDAANTAPARDRLLFDLFTTAFNDNATRGTLSVNVGAKNGPSLAAWSALFSGVVVLSNNAPDSLGLRLVPQYQNPPPSNSVVIIQPAGLAWTNSPLGQLVNGINNMRANFTNADGVAGAFEHAGDILSTLQFTEQSPFLNWNDPLQQTNAISDEMYEWLPQQVMSLLRCSSSPRYVIYCYGQTLKPAPDSVYTIGGQYFGMVTNYQVVSEIATRAVVRFNSTVTNVITTNSFGNWVSQPMVTNNNAVIESFNILPPD